MSNHLSYLDIPVLGGILDGTFIAKADVEGWALFGFLSKLQQTLFIKRDRGAAIQVRTQIQGKLNSGTNLMLFPEGTSTDGRSVYPFKSSLFSLFIGEGNEDVYLQPVTIVMKDIDGRSLSAAPGTPDDQPHRDIYAWHINMETDLGVHLWGFAKSKGAHIHIIYHPSIKAADHDDRKVLAKTIHEQVEAGLTQAAQA